MKRFQAFYALTRQRVGNLPIMEQLRHKLGPTQALSGILNVVLDGCCMSGPVIGRGTVICRDTIVRRGSGIRQAFLHYNIVGNTGHVVLHFRSIPVLKLLCGLLRLNVF